MVSVTNCLVLLLCVASALSASISFNTTYAVDCSSFGGCSFLNASIWDGGVVPSSNDDVSITIADTNATGVPFITLNSNISVHSISLVNATLWLQENATVGVASVNVGDNGNLHIALNSTVAISGSVSVAPTALLEVFGNFSVVNATFWGGVNVNAQYFSVADLVYGSSNINITNPLTSFGLVTLSIAANLSVTIEALSVSALNVAEYSNVKINNIATINSLQVGTGSTATFLGLLAVGPSASPLSGNGSVYVNQAATIAGDQSNPIFTGTLFVQLASTGIVGLHNITLNNLVILSAIGANQTIQVDGVTLPGTTTVVGQLSVNGQGLTAGQLIVAEMLSVINSSLTISDSLVLNTVGGDFTLQSSTFNLGGDVTGDLVIPVTSTLKITEGNATVFGNLVNSGILIVSGDHYLNVVGNATFNHDGEIQATLTGKNDKVLVVNGGSLLLDGILSYDIVKQSFLKSVTYLVAEAFNGTINGTFLNSTASALPGSQIDRDLDISYTINTVNVKYPWKVGDTQWWAWLILAIGIVIVLIVIIAIVVKCCRRRADYQPVR